MLYGKSPFLHENANIMFGKIMEEEPIFPREFKYSEESTDLIKKLLKKANSERIGYDDEQEIFTHPWFNDIDFAKLIAKKLPALVIPCVEEENKLNKTVSQKSIKELKMVDNDEEGDGSQNSFSLDLSFEKETTPKKNLVKGVNDSMEDFSYFEEDGWVETAIACDQDNLLEEFEDERRVQLLTNIEEYSEYSDEGGPIKERDALTSPPGETMTKSTSEGEEKVKRKGSVDSQFDEYAKKDKKDKDKESEKTDRKGSDPHRGNQKRADSSDKVNENHHKSNKCDCVTVSNKISPNSLKKDLDKAAAPIELSPAEPTISRSVSEHDTLTQHTHDTHES